jgi:hypothetical protein
MQTQDLILDIVPGGVPPVIDVTQYDTAREIKITLSSRTSASFALSSNYTYELRGTRANKTGFIDTDAVSMIDSRTLIFTTTGTMTSIAGECRCGILIFDGDEHIETINFIMQVHKSSLDLDTIVNSDDFRDLLDIAIGEYIAQHGTGVPPGGTTDQVLKKRSNNDLDTEWADESGGGGGAVNSVNGKTGNVVLDAVDVSALQNDTTAADLGAYVKPSGGIPKTDLASAVQMSLGKADTALQTAPVTSVNGQTGAVTITEGLAPLIGTTSTVTPAQVATALSEGRDICISVTTTFQDIPLELKFTAWNRATDTVYAGNAVDVVASQTIINAYGGYYLFELWGGVFNAQPLAWGITSALLATAGDIPTVPVQSVNNKIGAVILTASDVGAAPKVSEVTISSSGAASQALDPGKIYHFTGAITSLTLTLTPPPTGQLAQYHFDFESGSTPVTVTITGVTWPGGSFVPEASKRYECDILNGYGVWLAW